MTERPNHVSRRTAVKTISGAVAAIGFTGQAAATSGYLVEVNVGYDTDEAREAVLEAAETVINEYPFDAMTVEMSVWDAIRLSNRDDIRYVERNREIQVA